MQINHAYQKTNHSGFEARSSAHPRPTARPHRYSHRCPRREIQGTFLLRPLRRLRRHPRARRCRAPRSTETLRRRKDLFKRANDAAADSQVLLDRRRLPAPHGNRHHQERLERLRLRPHLESRPDDCPALNLRPPSSSSGDEISANLFG
jgi:hypothetical protein